MTNNLQDLIEQQMKEFRELCWDEFVDDPEESHGYPAVGSPIYNSFVKFIESSMKLVAKEFKDSLDLEEGKLTEGGIELFPGLGGALKTGYDQSKEEIKQQVDDFMGGVE